MTDPKYVQRVGQTGAIVKGTAGNVPTFNADGTLQGKPAAAGGGGKVLVAFFRSDDDGIGADEFMGPFALGSHVLENRSQAVVPGAWTVTDVVFGTDVFNGAVDELAAVLRIDGVVTTLAPSIAAGEWRAVSSGEVPLAEGQLLSAQITATNVDANIRFYMAVYATPAA